MSLVVRYSVLIPCFNAAPFVERTLESIVIAGEVCQALMPDVIFRPEIVCVDNASSDATLSVLHAAARLLPHLKVIPLHENWGPGGGRNVCLAHSTGDYILFCDHDDYYLPERIAVAFAVLLRRRALLEHYRIDVPESVDLDAVGAIYTGSECRGTGQENDVNAAVESFRLDYHLDGLLIRRDVLWLMDLFLQTQMSIEWYTEDLLLRDCLYRCINILTIPLALSLFTRRSEGTMHGVKGDGVLVRFMSNDDKPVFYRTKSNAHLVWLMQERPNLVRFWLRGIAQKLRGGLVAPEKLKYFKKDFLASLPPAPSAGDVDAARRAADGTLAAPGGEEAAPAAPRAGDASPGDEASG
jgi:glycosyltransferase involved in cell wall biosynthesis